MSETDEFPQHGVSAREKQRRFWNNSPRVSEQCDDCVGENFVDRTASVEGTLNRW